MRKISYVSIPRNFLQLFYFQDISLLRRAKLHFTRSMKEFPEKVHADRIWTYVSPLLIFLGTIGNILAITVLSRRRSRKSSIAIFLCTLGVSDIVHLNTGLLRQWIIAISETDIRIAGNAACKIHVFFVYFSGHCSSWLLVAVTCERFLGVWLPHKVKNGCSPKTSCIVIVVLLALLVSVDCNLLFALSVIEIKIDNITSLLVCGTSHEYAVNWHWIHLSVFCLIPFAILLIGNGSIILRLIKRRNHRKSQTSVEAKVDKTTQVTTLLVVLNIVFFINTLPICIYLIINPDTVDSSEHD